MRILVLNGPNLDRLGLREPAVYGDTTLADLAAMIERWAAGLGVEVRLEQTNSETAMIESIHGFDGDGIVVNPGAYTHTSRAIGDAIRAVGTPTVEVHISNVRAREPWRALSMVSGACVRTIYGRGVAGYRDAIRHHINRAALPYETIRYGPHDDNVGDLRRGGGDLVVIAHGGLWRQEYERDSTESLAVDLALRGFDTWNLEYRRLGGGGGWPGSAHDVLTALEHVPRLGLGSPRVTLLGHSAGSHLLMWAAARSSTPVAVHLALAPLLDLPAAIASGDVGADEARRLIENGAPTVMTPGGVPTVIVHGEGDEIVPVARTVAYAAAHGLDHHETATDHFSLLDPSRPEWEWVLDRLGAPA